MIDKKGQSDSFLRDLVGHRDAVLNSTEAGGAKYPIYKEVLSGFVDRYPPHTRLPAIRELAQRLGISLVTAQRVVTELIADGVLYSKPRAGVYVAEPVRLGVKKDTGAFDSSTPTPFFESTFCFGTSSVQPFQRPLWEELVEDFGERYPNIRARLAFEDEPASAGSSVDVYERLDWNVKRTGDEFRALNLRDFAPGAIATCCNEEGLLPLYYRSNFLFFNKQLLDECGIQTPDYRSFKEQLSYLDEAAPLLEAKGFDPRPFAVQQPVTLLGVEQLESFFSLVYDRDESRGQLSMFTESVADVLALCARSQRAPGFQNPRAQEERARFLEGKSAPFFLGHSVDYWQFGKSELPFAVECYPSLCADGRLFLWPMVGAVTQDSHSTTDAIRFLSYLVKPEAQERFARTGSYPIDTSSDVVPQTGADASWLKKTLAESKPMRLSSHDRFYIAVNVLNNELWHALLEHVPVHQAVEEALEFGRAFLRQNRTSAGQC